MTSWYTRAFNEATCIASGLPAHLMDGASRSRVPGAMEISSNFSDMAGQFCVNRANQGSGTPAASVEALRSRLLDANFTGDSTMTLEQAQQLRAQLRVPTNQFRPEAAMQTVTSVLSNPTGAHPSAADSQQLQNLIERTVPTAQEPAARQQPVVPPRATPTR